MAHGRRLEKAMGVAAATPGQNAARVMSDFLRLVGDKES
jgi:hypothetical protein